MLFLGIVAEQNSRCTAGLQRVYGEGGLAMLFCRLLGCVCNSPAELYVMFCGSAAGLDGLGAAPHNISHSGLLEWRNCCAWGAAEGLLNYL